jgi:hypothetical protein
MIIEPSAWAEEDRNRRIDIIYITKVIYTRIRIYISESEY